MKSIYEFNRQLKELYNDAAIFRPISDQRTGELYRYDAILKPDNLKAFMITVPEFYEFPFIGRGFQFPQLMTEFGKHSHRKEIRKFILINCWKCLIPLMVFYQRKVN